MPAMETEPAGAMRLPESRRRSVVLPAPLAVWRQYGESGYSGLGELTSDEQRPASWREVQEDILQPTGAIWEQIIQVFDVNRRRDFFLAGWLRHGDGGLYSKLVVELSRAAGYILYAFVWSDGLEVEMSDGIIRSRPRREGAIATLGNRRKHRALHDNNSPVYQIHI
jgi:hypothetical protein